VVKQNDSKPPEEDALAQCEEKVEHLQEENAVLRNAAQTFGELAERLSKNQHSVHQRRKTRARSGVPGRS
jgi:hypothetical protein